MIKKSTYITLIQMVLAFGAYSVATESESYAKIYPLPLIELKSVVSDWFLDAGYGVGFTSSKRGQVDITALKGQNRWQLSLMAHSPLATEVRTKIQSGVPADLLSRHIIQYLRELPPVSQKESRQAATPESVLSKVESVVCMMISDGNEFIQLSGFLISREGAILCTAHDLQDHSRVTVTLNDGREMEGRVVKIDVARDLAMVLIEDRFKHFVELRNGRNSPKKNERLFSVGCPMNVLGMIQRGILYGAPRRLNGSPLWQVKMVMHPGSSGSPVFDARGNLVAMIKGRYRGTDSLGFLIPLQTLLDFVEED